MKLIAQGAEAKLFLKNKVIHKERIKKNYRIKEIDNALRKQRTRKEAKLLEKCAGIVPKLLEVNDKTMTIQMEYLEGDLLKEVVEKMGKKEAEEVLKHLGKHIAIIHEKNIVHGDLTTTNVIVKKGKPYLIDFGLGFVTNKIEHKAVDLHLLKQALESKHHLIHKKAFTWIMEGYKSYKKYKEVLKQLQKVESRGRYKGKKA
jgi:TP53 regulating kinase-like protein|tara:strand:+ start:24456 stop:25061 length:606 start_codon:yes stop_codon:yes gene_type:complete